MTEYEKVISESISLDNIYVMRYLKLINNAKNRKLQSNRYHENHHIIPVAILPEYKKAKWNIVILTGREHYIAHWILAKIYGGNMWFAFNMMSRIGHTSALYEYGRKHMAEQSSIMNTGRIKSEINRKAISARTKNTVVVRDSFGEMSRVSRDDPRYISGELVFYRTGSKHTEETKRRMGLARVGLPAVAVTEETKKKLSKAVSGLIWITIKQTGVYKRVTSDKIDVNIHELGRVGFRGWDYINKRRKITIE